MKFIFTVSLLILISLPLCGQRVGRVSFPDVEGQISVEFHEFFMAHDSTYYVVQSDFQLYKFDGYTMRRVDVPLIRAGRALFFHEEYTLYGVMPDQVYRYRDGEFTPVKPDFKPEGNVYTELPYFDEFTATDNANHLIGYNEADNTFFIQDTLTIPEAYTHCYITTDKRYATYSRPDNEYVLYDNLQREILLESEHYVGILSDQLYQSEKWIYQSEKWKDGYLIEGGKVSANPILLYYPYLAPSKKVFARENLSMLTSWGDTLPLNMGAREIIKDGLDDDVLVGTHDGLFIANSFLRYYPSGDDHMPRSIHAVVEDQDQNIYVGSYGAGITQFDPSGRTVSKQYNCDVTCNRIMPGSFCLADGKVVFLSERHTFNIVYQGEYIQEKLAKDFTTTGYYFDTLTHERIGIGLYKKGLGIAEKDLSNLKSIGKEKGLQLENVQCFAQDRSGNIWCGRLSGGIARYDEAADRATTWKKADYPNGFGALSMEVDTRGCLWMGGKYGLYHLSQPGQAFSKGHTPFDAARKIDFPNGDQSIITFIKQVEGFLVVGSLGSLNFIPLDRFYAAPEGDYPIYQWVYGRISRVGARNKTVCCLIRKEDCGYVGRKV
jgi:hypothetical protein